MSSAKTNASRRCCSSRACSSSTSRCAAPTTSITASAQRHSVSLKASTVATSASWARASSPKRDHTAVIEIRYACRTASTDQSLLGPLAADGGGALELVRRRVAQVPERGQRPRSRCHGRRGRASPGGSRRKSGISSRMRSPMLSTTASSSSSIWATRLPTTTRGHGRESNWRRVEDEDAAGGTVAVVASGLDPDPRAALARDRSAECAIAALGEAHVDGAGPAGGDRVAAWPVQARPALQQPARCRGSARVPTRSATGSRASGRGAGSLLRRRRSSSLRGHGPAAGAAGDRLRDGGHQQAAVGEPEHAPVVGHEAFELLGRDAEGAHAAVGVEHAQPVGLDEHEVLAREGEPVVDAGVRRVSRRGRPPSATS